MILDIAYSKLSDEELDEKILKLQNIIFSSNINLSMQAQNILPGYMEERSKREDNKMQEYFNKNTNKQTKNNVDESEINNIIIG
jgi:hypothetical protein